MSDWTDPRTLLTLVSLGGSAAAGVYTWITGRTKANRAAIERVDEHLQETIRRVDRLEQRADAAPGHEDLGVVHDRITELSGSIRELTGVMKGLRRSVDRVETYLLEKEKK